MRYTLAGYLCRDADSRKVHTWQHGGTVLYSGLTAARLGASTRVLTCCRPEDVPENSPITWQVIPDQNTTTFFNQYEAETGLRTQYLLKRAASASLQQLTIAPDILHFAPLAGDLATVDVLETIQRFPDALAVATPQGWMREAGRNGIVHKITWQEAEKLLPHFHAVVLSEEDIQYDRAVLENLLRRSRTLLYTQGAQGATLYHDGAGYHIPAFPARVKDLTGAGDVIAAAFFVLYYETGDPVYAARAGSAAASLAIEHDAVQGIPDRAAIEKRLSG